MRVGVGWFFVPPAPFDPDVLAHYAKEADRLGFDVLGTPEHVAFPQKYASKYPYSADGSFPSTNDEMPFPDPLLPLAFAASLTRRIKFTTTVIILPQHHPLYLAKQLATLDVLSKGRMRVGIGSGWLKEEFEALGLDFHTRGARTDEAIQAMRVLWRENPSTFRGKHFNFGPLKSFPKPVQKNGIPIYVGGDSRAAIRRAARYGDGYIPTPGVDMPALLKQLREECAKIGRNYKEIDVIAGFYTPPTEDQLKQVEDLGINAIGSGISFTNDLDAITRDLETLANKLVAR